MLNNDLTVEVFLFAEYRNLTKGLPKSQMSKIRENQLKYKHSEYQHLHHIN